MKIRRAVITAAGRGQRTLPLQKVVARDGNPKSILQILCDEVAGAGIEEVAVVVRPGDDSAYAESIEGASVGVEFIEQREPLGYGHALACAGDFLSGEPFLHLVADHLFVDAGEIGCAHQLVEVAQVQEATVSAVQATRETELSRFGTVGATRVAGNDRLYRMTRVLEKPTPTEAEQSLHVPGLRAGHYLCFLGMHVLTPSVLEWIRERLGSGDAPVGLSEALDAVAQIERCLAFEVEGQRYDLAERYGLFAAQLALGLSGKDRDRVLSRLVEVLMQRELDRE